VGEDGEDDVEVDVEGYGAGQGVEVERADRLGEALFDVHAAGVVLDDPAGGEVRDWADVVGDEDGGLVVAEAGDGELAKRCM
jgi:hypothetical protein